MDFTGETRTCQGCRDLWEAVRVPASSGRVFAALSMSSYSGMARRKRRWNQRAAAPRPTIAHQ